MIKPNKLYEHILEKCKISKIYSNFTYTCLIFFFSPLENFLYKGIDFERRLINFEETQHVAIEFHSLHFSIIMLRLVQLPNGTNKPEGCRYMRERRGNRPDLRGHGYINLTWPVQFGPDISLVVEHNQALRP